MIFGEVFTEISANDLLRLDDVSDELFSLGHVGGLLQQPTIGSSTSQVFCRELLQLVLPLCIALRGTEAKSQHSPAVLAWPIPSDTLVALGARTAQVIVAVVATHRLGAMLDACVALAATTVVVWIQHLLKHVARAAHDLLTRRIS
jgi:hypothetical protein